MKVRGKVVWVTGASSGIGEAIVKQLASKGAKVVLSARREDKLQEVSTAAGLNASNSLVLPIDLLRAQQDATGWTKAVVEKFGAVDILINNSGVSQKSLAIETEDAIDRQLMEVNFWGGVFLTKAVSSQMIKQGSGHIAVVSSILSQFGLPLLGTYAAAKHAIYGWYESLRYEVKRHGINVTIISPGFINTDVTYKSLKEDGSELNENSVAQEKGMSPELCARKIVKAIESNRNHKYIGRLEILMPTVKWLFPKLFIWLMTKLSKAN